MIRARLTVHDSAAPFSASFETSSKDAHRPNSLERRIIETMPQRINRFSIAIPNVFISRWITHSRRDRLQVWPSFVAALAETQVILEHREEIS
jgi:hypothetical protein